MSRDRNNLQRHVEDCLADRSEMREWISQVQARSPWIQVSEWDWEQYGHLPIGEWLIDKQLDEEDPRDDWSWNWGDETWDAPDLHEWDDWERHEAEDSDWRSLQEDWERYWEPPDMEFGGQHYPAEHVRDARNLRRQT